MEGLPVNTSLYSLLIPFDNIGKVGYSHDFGLVKAGKENHYLALLESVFGMAGKMGQSTWPLAIANALRLNKEQREADVLGAQMLDERIKARLPYNLFRFLFCHAQVIDPRQSLGRFSRQGRHREVLPGRL